METLIFRAIVPEKRAIPVRKTSRSFNTYPEPRPQRAHRFWLDGRAAAYVQVGTEARRLTTWVAICCATPSIRGSSGRQP
jgi:hypothetical protein